MVDTFQRTPSCIVGLGNPGTRYEHTRHNLGFMALESIARTFGASPFHREADAQIATLSIAGNAILLCKPMTYMNLSGHAIAPIIVDHQIDLTKMMVISDDIALPLGSLRMRAKGSSGGHNGLQSIIDVLGTSDFPRLRCGVGTPDQGVDAAQYVLSRFDKSEREAVHAMTGKSAEVIRVWVEAGIERAMTFCNAASKPPEDGKSAGDLVE